MSKQSSLKKELTKTAKERFLVVANLVLDGFLVFIWSFIASIIKQYAIPYLGENNFDKEVLDIFQWVSGGATLGVLIIYIIRDLLVVLIRALKDLKNEFEKRD